MKVVLFHKHEIKKKDIILKTKIKICTVCFLSTSKRYLNRPRVNSDLPKSTYDSYLHLGTEIDMDQIQTVHILNRF